ncbi:MAG: nucleotidyltransferase family protein [Candidatus Omnitrophota bacterium]|nr:nucleotidyltransferase family protein [Candidatus Omnitrophota bacterium]
MKVIILAAGFGTRLYPLTEHTPKALLEVGGRTLLDHLMVQLNGIEAIQEVILVTNGKFYVEFFKWRKSGNFKKRVQIVDDGCFVPEKRLGAVKDLHLALKKDRGLADDYLILCADNYFDYPLSHFLLPCLGHQDTCFVGLYDIKCLEKAKLYGVVELDGHGRVSDFQEKSILPKSTLASLGVYYLPRKLAIRVYQYLEIEKLNPDRIGDFIGWLSTKEEMYGVTFDGRWFDIGDVESLREVAGYLAQRSVLNAA